MLLFVIDDYHARGVVHPKGTILDVSAETALFLMTDAPGCFSLKDPREKMETVQLDRMQKKARVK